MTDLEIPIQIIKTDDGFQLYDLNDVYLAICDDEKIAKTIADNLTNHEYLFIENIALKKRIAKLEAQVEASLKNK